MKFLPNNRFTEANRLATAGRFTEAMVQLQAWRGAQTAAPRMDFAAPANPFTPKTGVESLAGARNITPVLRSLPTRKPGSAKLLPAGARFEEHRFVNAAGARSHKLYTPSDYRRSHVV